MDAKYSPSSDEPGIEEELADVVDIPFEGAGAAQLEYSEHGQEDNDSVEVQIIEVEDDIMPESYLPPQEFHQPEEEFEQRPAEEPEEDKHEEINYPQKAAQPQSLRSKPDHQFTVYVIPPYGLEFLKATMTSENGFLVNHQQKCIEVKQGDAVDVKNKSKGISFKGTCEPVPVNQKRISESVATKSPRKNSELSWDTSLINFVVNTAPGIQTAKPQDYLWGLRVGPLPEVDYPNCEVWNEQGESLGRGYFHPEIGLQIEGWLPLVGEVKKPSKQIHDPEEEDLFEFWLPWVGKGTRVGKERPRYFLVKSLTEQKSDTKHKKLRSPTSTKALPVWSSAHKHSPQEQRYIPVKKFMLDLRDPSGNELFLDIEERDRTVRTKRQPLTIHDTKDVPFRIETDN